jgi:hypothetical protein
MTAQMLARAGSTFGTLLSNVLIGDGEYPCYVFIPPGPITRVVVSLHGGNGSADQHCLNMHFAHGWPISAQTANWQMLNNWNCVVIVPNGHYCNGAVTPYNPYGVTSTNQARTWANWAMWDGSQYGTVKFLKNASSYIDANWPGVRKILMGHSNGGMMGFRMRYEETTPATFHNYCFCSASANDYFVANPNRTGTAKPIRLEVGWKDTVICNDPAGLGAHVGDALIVQNPANASIEDRTYPVQWRGPQAQIQQEMTALGAGAFDPNNPTSDTAAARTWDYSGVEYVEVKSADHTILTHDQAMGSYLFYRHMTWAVAN